LRGAAQAASQVDGSNTYQDHLMISDRSRMNARQMRMHEKCKQAKPSWYVFQPASDTFAAAVDLLLQPFYSLLFLCSLSASKDVRNTCRRPTTPPPKGAIRPSTPVLAPVSITALLLRSLLPRPVATPRARSPKFFNLFQMGRVLHSAAPSQPPRPITAQHRPPQPKSAAAGSSLRPPCARRLVPAGQPVRAALASSGPSLLVFVMPHHHRQPLLVDEHGQFASPSLACCPCRAYMQ
jgi:hypothetical protein